MTKSSKFRVRMSAVLLSAAVLSTACGSASTEAGSTDTDTIEVTEPAATADATEKGVDTAVDDTETEVTDAQVSTESSEFQIDVWADNWSIVYVDGELVGEDSVPITTERSFNAETYTFEASYPFTVAVEAKDFKETDSGIEYIGEPNQQLGDGGIIAQITDLSTGEVIAYTDSTWTSLVIQQAPLNPACVNDADPDATCEFSAIDAPDGWTEVDYDDSDWVAATEWSAQAVDPKDGYDEIIWDSDAQLIWGTDLEIDNTILLRSTVSN